LRKNRPTKDKRIFNDAKVSDHHAIIPTEKKVVDSAGCRLKKGMFMTLWCAAYLAVFYPDHEYLSTTVIMRSGKDNFKASGRVVTEEGWRGALSETPAGCRKAAEKTAKRPPTKMAIPAPKMTRTNSLCQISRRATPVK
jgi:DNA topoisomerase-3